MFNKKTKPLEIYVCVSTGGWPLQLKSDDPEKTLEDIRLGRGSIWLPLHARYTHEHRHHEYVNRDHIVSVYLAGGV